MSEAEDEGRFASCDKRQAGEAESRQSRSDCLRLAGCITAVIAGHGAHYSYQSSPIRLGRV